MPFLPPLITSVGTALGSFATFLNSGTFLAGLVTTGISLGAEYALGQLIQPEQPPQELHLETAYGQNIPRSVVQGKRAVAGHRVYRNAHQEGNRHLQDVYLLSHSRINGVTRVRFRGRWHTLGGTESPLLGHRVQGTNAVIWVKVYHGDLNQTANQHLIDFSNPPGRWTENHRLAGIAYAVVFQVLDREHLPQPWVPLFEVEGLSYDWRFDDTAGGSGPQRWDDSSTWAPSDNPFVQMYNLERGFFLGDQLMVGKGVSASRLPLDKWTLAANIADEIVDGGKRYTSALVAVAGSKATHAGNMRPLLAASAASWFNLPAGEYPIAGANQATVATITDDDLMVEEPCRVSLKRTHSELINTVTGTFSDPETFYDTAPLATREDAAALATDGERLATSVPYDAVTDSAVGDRLNDIALRASRYQGNASVCLQPKFLELQPGDWIEWQSNKAGGFTKTFQILQKRLGPIGPRACRSVYLTLQEVDEGIFDPTAYTTNPPDIIDPGAPDYLAEVHNFTLTPIKVVSETGAERAAIRANWDAIDDVTVTHVRIRYWPTNQPTAVLETDPVPVDQTVKRIMNGVVGLTEYAVETKLVTDPVRTTVWSAPQAVTTLDARFGFPDIADEVEDLLEWVGDGRRELLDEMRQIIELTAEGELQGYAEVQLVREEVVATFEENTARWEQAILAVAGPTGSLTLRIEQMEATIPGLATTSAVDAVAVRVDDVEGEVTALGEDIELVETQVGNFSAAGLFRTTVESTETGADATIGISVAATGGGATETAALFLSALTGGGSAITLVADATRIVDSNGNLIALFSEVGGTVYLTNVVIGTAIIEDLSVTTGKIAANAIFDDDHANVDESYSTADGTPNNAWFNVADLSVDSLSGHPVLFSWDIAFSVSSSPAGLAGVVMDVRILRNGSVHFGPWNLTVPNGGSSSTSNARFLQDAVPSADTYTYTLQAKIFHNNEAYSANLDAALVAQVAKK